MVEESRQPGGDHSPHEGLEHPAVRYEHSDASFGWVFGILIAAAVLGVFIHVVVLKYFLNAREHQARVKESNYPLATDPSALPSRPRLEPVDRMERIERGNVYLRQESKERTLRSYGKVPGEEGYVHIPIDRAMDLLADKLPARSDAPSAERARKQNGLVDGGEPNSGRMFREKAPWYEP